LNEYQSIGELITDVDDYIEFYNHRKFHETLKYKKPMNVYQVFSKASLRTLITNWESMVLDILFDSTALLCQSITAAI
jgi:hypothetical protein